MKITITPPARAELNAAADYYEASRPGLGSEFADEFIVTYDRIKSHPQAGTPFRENIRYQMLNKFPYSAYYATQSEEIVIIAVVHQHRKPGYWINRIKGSKIEEPRSEWGTGNPGAIYTTGRQ